MLTTVKDLLQEAKQEQKAIGAFNVPNLESVRGVIAAAEELKRPVILQHAEVHNDLIPIEEIGPIMLDYAHRANVPVAVHLDHGASFGMCMKAIRLGFTSVMYDASSKNYLTNVKETKKITEIAHAVNVSVEAELGKVFTSSIGGGEGRDSDTAENYKNLDDVYTDPESAKAFVDETKVDCLAVAFGTVHGVYLTKPALDLNRILEIREVVDIPLVMHGGSGIVKEDYRTAIKNGIAKINYYTYMNKYAGGIVRSASLSAEKAEPIFFDTLSVAATEAVKNNVKKAIRIFS